jgi:hypothetical protein
MQTRTIVLSPKDFRDLTLIKINNVLSFEYVNPCYWKIVFVEMSRTTTGVGGQNCPVFAFETKHANAFSHFFFESIPNLRHYQTLKEKIPNLLLKMTNSRAYKKQLITYFLQEEPMYEDSSINQPRTVFFPRPVTSLVDNAHVTEYHEDLIFLFKLIDNSSYRECAVPADHSVGLLFRGQKDLYRGSQDSRDDPVYEMKLLVGNKAALHTAYPEGFGGFAEQVAFIKRHRMLFLGDGSAFLVNAAFARNQELFLMENEIPILTEQREIYKKLRMIFDFISRRNSVSLVSTQRRISVANYLKRLNGMED